MGGRKGGGKEVVVEEEGEKGGRIPGRWKEVG